ncbi:hypothetical protein NAK66_002464 [Klebsiella oxytoca]|nr:hypothetical protein [Klebsiella oxytoca]
MRSLIVMALLIFSPYSWAGWIFDDARKEAGVSLLLGHGTPATGVGVLYYCGKNGKIDITAVNTPIPQNVEIPEVHLKWTIGKNEPILWEYAMGNNYSVVGLEYGGKTSPQPSDNPDFFFMAMSPLVTNDLIKQIPEANGKLTLDVILVETGDTLSTNIDGKGFQAAYDKFLRSCRR